MSDLSTIKSDFIREVSEIKDETTMTALIDAYQTIISKPKSKNVIAVRKKFNADAIRKKFGQDGHDKSKIMNLIREMNIQEPTDVLISQLTR
jgi:putative IMPACT (imprinted ancient) family translation regulator